MKSFMISAKDEGMRLSRFLEKYAPNLSLSGMHKAIRTKHIKLNRKRTEASYKLKENDVVEIWLNDEEIGSPSKKSLPDFMRASKEINIIYEDESIAILYKPKGLFSHPVKGTYSDTLISRYLRHLYENGSFDPDKDLFTPALCNRLDRNTEGLVIVGKTLSSTQLINKMISDRNISKNYYAVCCGTPDLNGIYLAFLTETDNNTVVIHKDNVDHSVEIKTEFHTIKKNNDISLMEITLHTGRKHQIRAHLSFLGYPVLGDPKYGNPRYNKKYAVSQQLLTSYSLTFHCSEGELSYLDGKRFSLPRTPYTEYFS